MQPTADLGLRVTGTSTYGLLYETFPTHPHGFHAEWYESCPTRNFLPICMLWDTARTDSTSSTVGNEHPAEEARRAYNVGKDALCVYVCDSKALDIQVGVTPDEPFAQLNIADSREPCLPPIQPPGQSWMEYVDSLRMASKSSLSEQGSVGCKPRWNAGGRDAKSWFLKEQKSYRLWVSDPLDAHMVGTDSTFQVITSRSRPQL